MNNSTAYSTTVASSTDSVASRSKLASVLALSSTALSGALVANAQLIYTSGPLDVTVGVGGGDLSSYTIDLPGLNDFKFNAIDQPANKSVRVNRAPGATYVKDRQTFLTAGYFVLRANAGQTWNNMGGSGATMAGAFVAARGFSSLHGPGSFSHKYMAFEFKDTTAGGAVRYGWVDLSATVTASSGPSVTIHSWAYEGTGLTLGMSVPEPAESTAAVAGALLLGAAGLRTWRKRRLPAGA